MNAGGATTMTGETRTGRRKAVWGAVVTVGVVLSALLLASCGSQVRQGESTSYLLVENFDGSSGAAPDEFGNPIFSDVQTFVREEDIPCCPTFFNDLGRLRVRLGLKDPGTPGSPNNPTSNNFITITQYRVRFVRTDGRNTPGVDVPFGFDGALSFTVTETAQGVAIPFDLVRNAAKLEAPLRALRNGGGSVFIHAIAEVTFFGHDQTGREVSVTAQVNINFGDWADPEG
jgi:hypothetical protein